MKIDFDNDLKWWWYNPPTHFLCQLNTIEQADITVTIICMLSPYRQDSHTNWKEWCFIMRFTFLKMKFISTRMRSDEYKLISCGWWSVVEHFVGKISYRLQKPSQAWQMKTFIRLSFEGGDIIYKRRQFLLPIVASNLGMNHSSLSWNIGYKGVNRVTWDEVAEEVKTMSLLEKYST